MLFGDPFYGTTAKRLGVPRIDERLRIDSSSAGASERS
jgi:hypothetical protein